MNSWVRSALGERQELAWRPNQSWVQNWGQTFGLGRIGGTGRRALNEWDPAMRSDVTFLGAMALSELVGVAGVVIVSLVAAVPTNM